jgi:hypothetical protein
LHRHFKRLNENRVWREAKKIFIPENNLGMESAHLDTMVQDIEGVETFWEKDGRPGVCKDGKATRGYQFILTNLLATEGLLFDRDLFTVTKEKTPQCMLDMLMDQMYRYHWERKKAADVVMGKDRYALTGKIGNKQDDLLIALSMIPYWGRVATLNRNQ